MTPKTPRASTSFRGSLTGEDLSSQLDPFDAFDNFSDEDLERVTKEWRARAARGERDAFGVAHDCEVELRRRKREAEARALIGAPAATPLNKRHWWQFWRSSAGTKG